MPNPIILITGVAGFIGSNLAERLLADGYKVRGIDNLAFGMIEQIPKSVDFIKVDTRADIDNYFHGVDFVFHLAAKNCISDCQKDPLETVDINVKGTVNVFEAARKAKVKKVIYAESSALYEGVSKFPTPENTLCPQSVYAKSKWATHIFAEAYREFYGLKTTALRYFCVYGPKQDYRRSVPPLMSAFIINLLKGKSPVIYGSGKKRRDFIYIDDVNEFHIQCLKDSKTDGQIYNLGSGVNYSVMEIFKEIAALLKSDLKPIFKSDLPGEAETTLADISAAKALGWRPRILLQDGLQRSIRYIKDCVFPAGMT